MQIKTGKIPFREFRTSYRIVGDLDSDNTPLILLHGGPGSTHNYFESFDELAETNRPVIMYDQLGCGESSIPKSSEFYTPEVWLAELQNLIQELGLKQYYLLGQSWGGMLAIIFATEVMPREMKGLILSSTLSSAKLWAQEQHRLIRFLPENEQEAIAKAEAENNFSGNNYKLANQHFMELHATGPYDDQTPEYLTRPKRAGIEAYEHAWGPNEYVPSGVLHDYDYTEKLAKIDVPTLITSGTNDLCTPLVAKTMFDKIRDVKWILFENSRHMPFIDEHEKYMIELKNWLEEKDANQ